MAEQQLLLWIILAVLLGVVYSLKRMFILEKRIATMELGIGKILSKIEKEELKIENAVIKKKK